MTQANEPHKSEIEHLKAFREALKERHARSINELSRRIEKLEREQKNG